MKQCYFSFILMEKKKFIDYQNYVHFLHLLHVEIEISDMGVLFWLSLFPHSERRIVRDQNNNSVDTNCSKSFSWFHLSGCRLLTACFQYKGKQGNKWTQRFVTTSGNFIIMFAGVSIIKESSWTEGKTDYMVTQLKNLSVSHL